MGLSFWLVIKFIANLNQIAHLILLLNNILKCRFFLFSCNLNLELLVHNNFIPTSSNSEDKAGSLQKILQCNLKNSIIKPAFFSSINYLRKMQFISYAAALPINLLI